MLPHAGWYPDPDNPQFHRWWDGQKWTSATYPRGDTQVAPVTTTGSSESASAQSSKGGRWKFPAVVVSVLAISAIITFSVSNSDDTRRASSQRTTVAYTPPSTPRQNITTTEVAIPAPAPVPAVVAPPAAPVSPPSRSGIGKPYRDGKFEFVVHSWDGQTASITIRNIGDRPQTVSVTSLYLIDTNDRKFEPEYDWTSDLVLASLNPGQSASGNLTYVLSGATASHLELHDSMFSGGVDVPLR